MLGGLDMVAAASSQRYLLGVTQHRIGGFAKAVGAPPDLFHSYLGLAALALLGDARLRPLDVALYCSAETARSIELAREGLLAAARAEGFDGDGFWESVGAAAK